jgi:hypothetical protein
MLSLHRPTSSSSSTTNFPWLSPCFLVRVLLSLIFVTCNCFIYIGEERTWTYSKHISRDRYPASLLARRSDIQKTHVTWSSPTAAWRHRDYEKNSLFRCVRLSRAWPRDDVLLLLLVGTCLRSCCLAMRWHVTVLVCSHACVCEFVLDRCCLYSIEGFNLMKIILKYTVPY